VRPWNQVKPSSGHSNKFILSNATTQNNWQPLTDVTIIDMLWRPSGYAANDPCAHFQPNGTYHPFWNDEGSGVQTGGPACGPVVTWRTPSQDEWANIYRGGTLVGSPANALANTWTWKSGSGNFARGFGISPTNSTATDVETLFLPATGSRISGNGNLYNAGSSGHYWSSSFVSTMAYGLGFNSGTVNPAGQSYRGAGFALRCIRN
jgi:hypothetical protein